MTVLLADISNILVIIPAIFRGAAAIKPKGAFKDDDS